MNPRLALQKCWNHTDREAVGRCPECTRFFCRECVVEHESRIVCSACLSRILSAAAPKKSPFSFAPLLRATMTVAGFILAWLTFFWVGRALIEIPHDTHAMKLWQRQMQDAIEESMDE
jgi:hypothetical protein